MAWCSLPVRTRSSLTLAVCHPGGNSSSCLIKSSSYRQNNRTSYPVGHSIIFLGASNESSCDSSSHRSSKWTSCNDMYSLRHYRPSWNHWTSTEIELSTKKMTHAVSSGHPLFANGTEHPACRSATGRPVLHARKLLLPLPPVQICRSPFLPLYGHPGFSLRLNYKRESTNTNCPREYRK